MTPALYAAIAAFALLGATGANEMTHGGFAETMGFGHQHMVDYGGYHCVDADHPMWDDHVDHMHADGGDHCGGGHMGADHMGGGMGDGMGGGMRGGA